MRLRVTGQGQRPRTAPAGKKRGENLKYFQKEMAFNYDAMQNIVEEASYMETEAEQVQSVLEGVAGYMIIDLQETISELHEQGVLKSVDDVCSYLYHLFDE